MFHILSNNKYNRSDEGCLIKKYVLYKKEINGPNEPPGMVPSVNTRISVIAICYHIDNGSVLCVDYLI